MKLKTIIFKLVLWILLSIGLYGALSVSYTTITGTLPCPNVAGIPACFIVLAGYAMMIATLLTQYNKAQWLFLFGWVPVFLLAFVGTLFEISNGNTCPKNTSGLALCYVSFVFSIIVALTYFLWLKARKA